MKMEAVETKIEVCDRCEKQFIADAGEFICRDCADSLSMLSKAAAAEAVLEAAGWRQTGASEKSEATYWEAPASEEVDAEGWEIEYETPRIRVAAHGAVYHSSYTCVWIELEFCKDEEETRVAAKKAIVQALRTVAGACEAE